MFASQLASKQRSPAYTTARLLSPQLRRQLSVTSAPDGGPRLGRPVDSATRDAMERSFGYDFSQVRIHTDETSAGIARILNARAFTLGSNVFFHAGQYEPASSAGRALLAHELAHVVQQSEGSGVSSPSVLPRDDPGEAEADRAASAAVRGDPAVVTPGPRAVQQQGFRAPATSVRSPVFEETVTDITDVSATLGGRRLTSAEIAVARGVFANSIDFSRVRLIPTRILEYRTVGNAIRVPRDFTMRDQEMAQTFIHELTHVWQYQHGGTSYLSVSLVSQIGAQFAHGNRNFAYAYRITPDLSFFSFSPEQQAMLVENYFAMLRDRLAIPADQARGRSGTYYSNHFDSSGFAAPLTAGDRLAEISRELPMHERLIQQMQEALPRSQAESLLLRASDVMQVPAQALAPLPGERQLTPVRPLLELRFPGF